MEKIIKETEVFGKSCVLELIDFNEEDKKNWKELFDAWKELRKGMHNYNGRSPNLPEALSEVAFCLYSGSKKFSSLKGASSSSFDTFNLKTKKAEQIKATSVERDLTSFGPLSEWDDLYFLDFYNNGDLDGSFDVYKIPKEIIYEAKVNKKQTLKDQQKEGKRPRLSIKEKIINKTELIPQASNVKVWE